MPTTLESAAYADNAACNWLTLTPADKAQQLGKMKTAVRETIPMVREEIETLTKQVHDLKTLPGMHDVVTNMLHAVKSCRTQKRDYLRVLIYFCNGNNDGVENAIERMQAFRNERLEIYMEGDVGGKEIIGMDGSQGNTRHIKDIADSFRCDYAHCQLLLTMLS